MLVETLVYVHVMSLAMWFGGLFGYQLIVWPTLIAMHPDGFPRATLVAIGRRTAPWIYLAMAAAAVSYAVFCAVAAPPVPSLLLWGYALLLAVLIGNNVYGSVVAWPRIMLTAPELARRTWAGFYLRMACSLVLGLGALSAWVVLS